jgi:hypothetical protein
VFTNPKEGTGPGGRGWVSSGGYHCLCIWDPDNQISLQVQYHVWLWEQWNGPVPDGMVIHHKDFDRLNNVIENFVCVTRRDHLLIHRGWFLGENGEWMKRCRHCGKEGNVETGYTTFPSGTMRSVCDDCAREIDRTKRANDPELARAKKNAYYKRNRDKLVKQARDWRASHPDETVASQKKWKDTHPKDELTMEQDRVNSRARYAALTAEQKAERVAKKRARRAANRALVAVVLLSVASLCYAQIPAAVDGVYLPAPDCGFGLFYCPQETANETWTFAAMRDAGCNTLAVQARPLPGQQTGTAAEAIARELNNAAQVGLLDPTIPVICYSVDPPDVVAAKSLKDPTLKWPELIQQSVDEPNHTQEATLRQYRDAAHALGLRIGTAVAGYVCTGYTQELPWCAPEDVGKPVPGMGMYLDFWVCLVGTWGEGTREAAKAQGAELGAYLAYPSSIVLDRWTCGLWAWKARVRMVLLWAALNKQVGWDYSRVAENPAGAAQQPGLVGIAAGIIDYRVLQAVRDLHTAKTDEWLASVEAQVPLNWWPRNYVKDNQDKEVPTIDMDKIRAEGLAFLKEAQR